MPTAPAIEAFWTWWEDSGRVACEQAVESNAFDEVAGDLQQLVKAIDPGLELEFGKGALSKLYLCVTAGGRPGLRPTAERWLLAGPLSDDTWEYRAARASDHSVFEEGEPFEVGGLTVDPDQLRLGIWIDDERQIVDVELWHPGLASAAPEQRRTAASLMLDWLLGEDACERWIGRVDLVDAEPEGALLPLEFVTAVEELERRHLEPTYALMSGTMESRPVIIIARRPLKRVEFPLFDLRVDARLVLDDPTSDGFPDPDLLDGLTLLEDDFSSRLGDQGVVAAVVTHSGVRTFHIYCDQEGTGPAIAQEWVAAHPDQTIVLSFELDPAWEAVAPYC